MALMFSTNMYGIGELHRILDWLKKFEGCFGVEVFPLFEETGYEAELKECLEAFSGVPVSFHGPYYGAEHSAPEGSVEYRRTQELLEKTLEYSRKLHARYLVFHHNNCAFLPEQQETLLRTACRNYREVEVMFQEAGIPVYVENAGVKDRGNMLLDEEAFISLCRSENYPVLIDIGHAFANGWNLPHVMEELAGQICAYHLHSNDGQHDCHWRVHGGKLDFDAFVRDCRRLTPNVDWVMEYGPSVANDTAGIEADLQELLAVCPSA